MRAVACQDGNLEVVELADPQPGPGQVLLEVTGCGICGSDLHARHHADAQADVLAEVGYAGFARSSQQVVFGHEFTGRVAGYGQDASRKVPLGAAVVALPLRTNGRDIHPIGLSSHAPGAYAEAVLVEEAFMFRIPDGLTTELAALTEPMAVALHAVRRSEIARKDAAVVIGCGPVGLAVIAMLKASGVSTVVASDFSAGRRALASACGADVVVDPAEGSPISALSGRGYATSMSAGALAGLGAMKKLRQLPLPWDLSLRVLESLGATKPKRPVIFECVGLPGVIESILTTAPLGSRVVIAGVCMQPDTFRPAVAINKELDLRFAVGYTPLEFHDTLRMLADGKVKAGPLVTGSVGLEGVGTPSTNSGVPASTPKSLSIPG
ncbi:MAG TPA: zinc-binding dehydrogenase [Acidimicrobiales bacterium]|nr:zinc-binding dehydrogenase [Acidimicrobiales bacterium]